MQKIITGVKQYVFLFYLSFLKQKRMGVSRATGF